MQIPSAGASPYVAPGPQASPASGQLPRSKAESVVDEFRAYAQMTPAEKMRAAILGSMGLSEDDLKAMDPKERAKIEEKIKTMIKQKVEDSTEKQTGVAVDLKA